MPGRPRLAWVLAAIVAAAVATDFALDQGRRVFWFDEVLTALLARAPTWDDFQLSLQSGAHHTPPAYFVAMRAWCSVVGEGSLGFRLPSLVCTLAGSALLTLVLRRMFGLWPAVLGACASLATSPVLLANLGEARPGAAWWFLQMAWLWVVVGQGGSVARAAGAFALALAIPSVHYGGFVFTAMGAAALLATSAVLRTAEHARVGLASAVGLALFTATHLELALLQQQRNLYEDWIPTPSLTGLTSLYQVELAPAWELLLLVCCGALLGIGRLFTRAVRSRTKHAFLPLAGVASGWLVTPLLLWGVEAVGGPNLVYTRYTVPLDAVAALFSAGCAAWALRALGRAARARTAAAVCAAVSAVRVLADPTVHTWAVAAYAVDELAATGATVYGTDLSMMLPLAWVVRDPERVVLLARNRSAAAQLREVTPLVRAFAWDEMLLDAKRGLLVLTPQRSPAFSPDAWMRAARLRAVGHGGTPGVIEVWRVEPVP